MSEKEEILGFLKETIGEEGCGFSCDETEIFKDEQGWKIFLGCFMEPWYLGRTAEEAKSRIREYASQGFGFA
jgi:hypothetical protein